MKKREAKSRYHKVVSADRHTRLEVHHATRLFLKRTETRFRDYAFHSSIPLKWNRSIFGDLLTSTGKAVCNDSRPPHARNAIQHSGQIVQDLHTIIECIENVISVGNENPRQQIRAFTPASGLSRAVVWCSECKTYPSAETWSEKFRLKPPSLLLHSVRT